MPDKHRCKNVHQNIFKQIYIIKIIYEQVGIIIEVHDTSTRASE